MPYTVNSSFEGFIKHVVNTSTERTKAAQNSRQNLLDNISSLTAQGELPTLYHQKHINYGSFERKTKICEVDDVDMMLCLDGSCGTYTSWGNNRYTINIAPKTPVLSDLCNEDNTLNSRRLINLYISKLDGLRDYRKAELHRNKEAMTLKFKSYEWNFDVVPCFYATDDFYLIPDGNGEWKRTDPRIDANRIDTIDSWHKQFLPQTKNVREFVRLMKYWKLQKWSEDYPNSYAFEQMILTFIERYHMSQDWATNVKNCLLFLSTHIKASLPDPRGIQGNLNNLDPERKLKYSQIAYQDYKTASLAVSCELTSNVLRTNHSEAINHWNTIFGNKFKTYGEFYE